MLHYFTCLTPAHQVGQKKGHPVIPRGRRRM